jgi:hypothetical protein
VYRGKSFGGDVEDRIHHQRQHRRTRTHRLALGVSGVIMLKPRPPISTTQMTASPFYLSIFFIFLIRCVPGGCFGGPGGGHHGSALADTHVGHSNRERRGQPSLTRLRSWTEEESQNDHETRISSIGPHRLNRL